MFVLVLSLFICGEQNKVQNLNLSLIQNSESEGSLEPPHIIDDNGDGDPGQTESMILNEQQRRELAKNFPGRCVSRYWLLGNAIFIEDPDVLTDTDSILYSPSWILSEVSLQKLSRP